MITFNFRALPVKTFVLIFLIVLAVINIVSVTIIFVNLSDNNAATDVAGRNRMLSQRIALYARLYLDGDQNAAEVCKTAIDLYDRSLLALKHGGEAPNMPQKMLSPASGEVVDYLNRAQILWEPFRDHARKIVNQANAANHTAIVREGDLDPKIKASFYFLSSNANQLLTANDDLVQAYSNQAKSERFYFQILLSIGVLLSMGVLISGYQLLNKILFEPLNTIAASSASIAKGDYSQNIQYDGKNELATVASSLNTLFDKFRKASDFVSQFGKGNHEYDLTEFKVGENYINDTFIQSLLETQEALRKADIENQHRIWSNEGFARFGDILRNNHESLQQLGRELIVHLTKYLEINQGGVFILNKTNPDDMHLELVGCYAYNREKFITKRIEIGEGLVGEVYQEGLTKYMVDIPKNYMHITSGLGKANPSSLLIVPLKMNEEIFGVLELASIGELEQYKIDFVEKLSENIASTIASVRVNEVTKLLYEQSQVQSEELRAQEEEMRQNMEELQATQEEMRRKEQEYIDRIMVLEAKVGE